jgi:hypothetical protein
MFKYNFKLVQYFSTFQIEFKLPCWLLIRFDNWDDINMSYDSVIGNWNLPIATVEIEEIINTQTI